RVKPDEGGVVRVSWVATKAGPEFRLRPKIVVRREGDPVLYEVEVSVPVVVRAPIRFDADRLRVGVLSPGKTIKKEFDAGSAARAKVDFKLVSSDPLFNIVVTRLEKEELDAKKKDLRARKLAIGVLCAFKVTVTIHESKEGKFLDQGSFYRKFPVALDGNDPD